MTGVGGSGGTHEGHPYDVRGAAGQEAGAFPQASPQCGQPHALPLL